MGETRLPFCRVRGWMRVPRPETGQGHSWWEEEGEGPVKWARISPAHPPRGIRGAREGAGPAGPPRSKGGVCAEGRMELRPPPTGPAGNLSSLALLRPGKGLEMEHRQVCFVLFFNSLVQVTMPVSSLSKPRPRGKAEVQLSGWMCRGRGS